MARTGPYGDEENHRLGREQGAAKHAHRNEHYTNDALNEVWRLFGRHDLTWVHPWIVSLALLCKKERATKNPSKEQMSVERGS
jgi:hypothetical protein